jgi:CheY-like chemotaxis protein
MAVPKRIVLVDDDAKVRQLIEYRLRPPEFQFFGFTDGRDALMKLHDIKPDLIVSDIMMPDMDGRLFFQVVKRSTILKDVPFLFVSAVRADAAVMAALDAGADAFLVKPFPVSQLVAKIRNTLGMREVSDEASAPAPARHAAAGVTPLPTDGSEGAADTGPIPVQVPTMHVVPPSTPEAAATRAVAEAAPRAVEEPAPPALEDETMQAQETETTAASSAPAVSKTVERFPQAVEKTLADTSSDDFFDMLLTAQGPKATRVVEPPAKGGTPPPPPQGRLSTLERNGKGIQVRTEVRTRPTFAVITTVGRASRVLRRIETAWEHPLDRIEDRYLVKRQIDLQHEQALAMIDDLTVEATPRRVFWGSQERSVDTSVLCRAMTLLADQLRPHVGAEALLGLLRRSHAARSHDRGILHSFYIRSDGTVLSDRGRGSRLPHDAVVAVASWAAELLTDASRMSDRARNVRIRQVTRPVSDELERLGFYTAFDGQAAAPGRPRLTRLPGHIVSRTV